MKRFILAVASLTASFAFAQTPASAPAAPVVDQPKHKCEDPGEFPGRIGMSDERRRKKFVGDIDKYKTCMMNFVEERKATIKANELSARAAIDEYNSKMKVYNDAQDAIK